MTRVVQRLSLALFVLAGPMAAIAFGQSGPCREVQERPGCSKSDPGCDPFNTPPIFVVVPRPDGTPCTVGSSDLCDDTSAGSCLHGTCILPPKTCAPLDTCHTAGTCDPATGQCSNPVKPDDTLCDDGDRCTVRELCSAGVCKPGVPVVCSGPTPACGEPLACDPSTGACVSQPRPDDSPCDDGNLCTRLDRCERGACVGDEPLPCTGRPAAPGTEVPVNVKTTGYQFEPAACRTDGGQLIVVWADLVPGDKVTPTQSRIVGRRYNAADGSFGAEFQVDTAGVVAASPDVACAANGSFVVIWSAQVKPSDVDVFARRYAADATPLGDPFTVNTVTNLAQGGINQAAVASDADGNFVAVWSDRYDKDENTRISARRYAADGTPRGDQFAVNAYVDAETTLHTAERPDVAIGPDGDVVVAWTAMTAFDLGDVFARRYAADGTPRGDEFLVNIKTTDSRQGVGPDVQPQGPAVAMLANGDAAVVWTSDVFDANEGYAGPASLWLQRFPAVGLPAGPEMRLDNTGFAAVPDVAAVGDGFVVSWTRLTLTMGNPPVFVTSSDVLAQRFAADGSPIDEVFPVNHFTGEGRLLGAVVELKDIFPVLTGGGSALAGGSDGAYAVAWESAGRPAFYFDGTPAQHGQDGDRSGIYAQRFLVDDACRDTAICNPTTGQCGVPRTDGTTCDDGDACTTGDQCAAGACSATPVQCRGGICHDAGVCDPQTGACVPVEQPDGTRCEEGNLCTVADTCQAGVCVAGAPRSCGARDPCHEGSCDLTNGQCVFAAKPDGTGCEDSDRCTIGDTCRAGACSGGAPLACAPAGPCQEAGVCIPKVGLCTYADKAAGTACDDANLCTVNDRCANGTCAAGAPVICGGNPAACHDPYVCDARTGTCTSPPSADGGSCDDGNACTLNDQCVTGTCGGKADPRCGPLDAVTCWVAAIAPKTRAFATKPAPPHGDEFATYSNEYVARPQRLCQAAAIDGGPVSDPTRVLGCYDLRNLLVWQTSAATVKATHMRTLKNRFGQQTVKVLRTRGALGESLCTPVSVKGSPPAILPRHRCYRALPTKALAPVPLFDVSAALGKGRFRLGALSQYCTPLLPSAQAEVLACYNVIEDRPSRITPPDQAVSSELGVNTLRLATVGRTLCVPSTVVK